MKNKKKSNRRTMNIHTEQKSVKLYAYLYEQNELI